MQTHVSRAVADKDLEKAEQGAQLLVKRGEEWWASDVRKSAALHPTPSEPYIWPARSLEGAFHIVEGGSQRIVFRQTQQVTDMIRQHLEDTILPWRYVTCCIQNLFFVFQKLCSILSTLSGLSTMYMFIAKRR